MSIRPILETRRAKPTMEGAGVHLHRAFGFQDPTELDPFLLFDDFRNDDPMFYRDGFPWHPHRGIETITYVLAGTVEHADSLGNRGRLGPGSVQWMTAGSGVVHSERSSLEARAGTQNLFGLQAWVALPADKEEVAASFAHHGKGELPVIAGEGKQIRVVAGSLFGMTSPLAVSSPLIYADVLLDAGAVLPIDPIHPERAVHVLTGAVEVDGERVAVVARIESGQIIGDFFARREGGFYCGNRKVTGRRDALEQGCHGHAKDWRKI